MARVQIRREGMTVDLVCWQHFGRQDDALVAQCFDLNRGLADLGLILPVGTEFELPEDAGARTPLIETVRLWT